MISSPSAQIVNAIAEATRVTAPSGIQAPAYGPTMAVATAIIAVGIVVTTAFGPEKRGRQFESAITGMEQPGPKQIDLEDGLEESKRAEEIEQAGQVKT